MNNDIDDGEAFGPGAVLALFRHGQAHTRNDLMRLTGLARSTSGLALRGSLHGHFVTTIAAKKPSEWSLPSTGSM
jgi:hypothetical protein